MNDDPVLSIRALELHEVALPLVRPFRTSFGEEREKHAILVRLDGGEATGWGCDVAAWMYGRDPRGGGVLATGDVGVLRLPRWFPFS